MIALISAMALATGLAAPFDAPPPSAPSPVILTLDTTSYCQSGTMADGQETYWGAAAGNRWAFGTRLKLLTGRFAGRIVTVADRIGWGSQLDIFTWSCNEALWYGREEVQVEVVQ